MPSVAHKHNLQKKKNTFDNTQDDDEIGYRIERHLLLLIILVRFANIFVVRTSFVPDEYWQSLEVAHNSVFGYGYLTWEWTHGLRSYAYPAVFATAYHVLRYFGLDNAALLVYVPRIMQAVLSAVGDWFFYHFAKKQFGSEIAKFSLLSCVTSWFWWYCATRTIINTVETSVLCMGLYYYSWQTNNGSYARLMVYQLMAISICVIRPTAVVIWVPLAFWHLYRSRKISVLMSYVFCTLIVFAFSTFLDRYYYAEWTSVHWNFFTFNILKNLGVHYGTHPWHWYLTQGVPVVLGPQVPFFLYGIFSATKKTTMQAATISKCLVSMFVCTIFVYSLISHKEFRFILHLIPIASIFCGMTISRLSKKWQKYAVQFLVATNLPIALYTGLVHQRGALKITDNLRGKLSDSCDPRCPGGVLYLTPCHATPLYSHLHINVTTRFLTCPPNLLEEAENQDEADEFYEDPTAWLDKNIFFKDAQTKIDQKFYWVVIFDNLYEKIQNYKPLDQYRICSTEFHSHFPEGRTGKYVHILCQN